MTMTMIMIGIVIVIMILYYTILHGFNRLQMFENAVLFKQLKKKLTYSSRLEHVVAKV